MLCIVIMDLIMKTRVLENCYCQVMSNYSQLPSELMDILGRDSVVGIATCYGLDGPGIESQWGRGFPHPSKTSPGAHPASYTMGTGSLSRG
jgi:hypothetical protein